MHFFYPFFCTLYTYLSKYVILKTSQWSKVLNETIWYFFVAHLQVFLKIIFFNSKVFKLQRDSSVTLNVSSKNLNLSGKIENNFHKNPNFASTIFPQWFGQKEIEPIGFLKYFMKNQLKLMFPKISVFRPWKGSNIWTLFYLIFDNLILRL